VRNLSSAILAARENGRIPIVVDIKPISPRDGVLVGQRDPSQLARALVMAGACALSVVTEPENFGGSLDLLRRVVQAVNVPVLRKDFISSPGQVDETLEAGAAAILLTLATIPELALPGLYRRVQALGLEAVVEVHTEEELRLARSLEPTIIGINNRNILRLEKDPGDVGVTEKLAPLVPEGTVILSESSLLTARDIQRAFTAGADAVLVGTAVLQSEDPASRIAELTKGVRV
jgi:indole-3-glycerol phosphate synthase